MEFERVLHFGTPELPDPYCGNNVRIEFEKVLHVGTPESPEPKRGIRLETKI